MAVDVDKVIASITVTGSLLSAIATLCVLVSFAIYHRQLRVFRHVLVLNLTVAGRSLFPQSDRDLVQSSPARSRLTAAIRVRKRPEQHRLGTDRRCHWQASARPIVYRKRLLRPALSPGRRLFHPRHRSCYSPYRNAVHLHARPVGDKEAFNMYCRVDCPSHHEPRTHHHGRDEARWRELVLDFRRSARPPLLDDSRLAVRRHLWHRCHVHLHLGLLASTSNTRPSW